ncbi:MULTISPECIES: hypothetical protein [Bacillus]|uniref:Lipoprotein n=2 Tax=Bacillus cereus TaxID=1396 RepID=A0AAN0SZT0_BACCE|nr:MULTISPECIES: hypothetical protein [Bacillus cereus group]ABK84310.1 conserved hypothetical protein [Bacillus thuringiensis str. Al Hakam]AJH67552.1 hypothetical protein BF32_4195 [Bacillus thuringiensis]AJI13291.1 hypothetical protein AK40_5243 [Bacillus cereus 03BB108]EDX63693.1 conserved hypothetical protein [Bacillus cereus 03BB108]EEK57680.1 hypothetical protein bcere0004_9460 [Bacillus cereus BGSC 6E1]
MRKLLTVIGITFLMLAGCSNGDFEKEIDAGKTALTNKEYKNALSSFERALDEKKDDSGAIVLVEQTKIMMEAVKLKEEKKIEESIQLFEKVENMKDGNTTLIKQAKEERTALLAILEQKKKYSEQLTKSEELINKKNYAEAKETLNKLVLETKDNKNLEEYNKKAVGLVTKMNEEEKTEKGKATAKAQKTSAVTSQKVAIEKTQKTEVEKNQKVEAEKNQKVETGKNQNAFTFEKAKEYIKNEYKEDYDYTLENTQVENGKKYYQIRVHTTYKIEGAAGPGFTGVFKVFEDGTIIEVQ